jgi:hypothetical protein
MLRLQSDLAHLATANFELIQKVRPGLLLKTF